MQVVSRFALFSDRENRGIQANNTWKGILPDLFDGEWTRRSFNWSKSYTGAPMTFSQGKSQAIIVNRGVFEAFLISAGSIKLYNGSVASFPF